MPSGQPPTTEAPSDKPWTRGAAHREGAQPPIARVAQRGVALELPHLRHREKRGNGANGQVGIARGSGVHKVSTGVDRPAALAGSGTRRHTQASPAALPRAQWPHAHKPLRAWQHGAAVAHRPAPLTSHWLPLVMPPCVPLARK